MTSPLTKAQLRGRADAMARWRERNRAHLNAERAAARADRRAQVAAIKEASPCTDCGAHFPAVCMDFDHTGTDKAANVARLVADGPMARILREIEKCDLVCANCHRLRTATRRRLASEQNPPTSQTSSLSPQQDRDEHKHP